MSRLEKALLTQQRWESRFSGFSRFPPYTAFEDFLVLASCTLANTSAPPQARGEAEYREREDRVELLRQKYGDEYRLFSELLGDLVLLLDRDGPLSDPLGTTFMGLQLARGEAGQYFTPMNVCMAMAEIVAHDLEEKLRTQPFVTVGEPSSGCGRMPLALSAVLRQKGFPPEKHMFVGAQDIDARCVAMTFISLSLTAVPAVVSHGDALRDDVWGKWVTPMARPRVRLAAGLDPRRFHIPREDP